MIRRENAVATWRLRTHIGGVVRRELAESCAVG
jgi:hypothetical protein